jgi:hypothetical protein
MSQESCSSVLFSIDPTVYLADAGAIHWSSPLPGSCVMKACLIPASSRINAEQHKSHDCLRHELHDGHVSTRSDDL